MSLAISIIWKTVWVGQMVRLFWAIGTIIWKSILVGQMVRLFWAIGTVREFEG